MKDNFKPLSADQTSLLHASPFPTLVLDSTSRIRYANASATLIGESDGRVLIGRLVWECYPEIHQAIVDEAHTACNGDGESRNFNGASDSGDGAFAVSFYPWDSGIVAILESRYRRSSAIDANAHQLRKMESLGLLAGGVAHDFNNLLVGILGNASLALLDLPSDAEARRSVEEIELSAQRAADLTRQLLAYAGKVRFVVESIDLSSLIVEMKALLRTAVPRHIDLAVQPAPGLPSVEVDTSQLRQVLMNLVANSSDAIGEKHGSIQISTGYVQLTANRRSAMIAGQSASCGPHVILEVTDTGTGIEAETRDRIFDPFFSTKATGRGLGLATTLGIVRGHKGAIELNAEVGAGTSIRLFFPASKPQKPQRTERTRNPSEWQGTGRVLIADDEQSVRAVAGTLLKRRGFLVTEAEDGLRAVELFGANPDDYALVILDLTMPGLGGEATFNAIRELRSDIPVVLMSGYNEQEVSRIFENRGLAGFLQKPFRADELYATVVRTLGIERRTAVSQQPLRADQ